MWFVGGYVEDRASEQSGGLTGWLLVAGSLSKGSAFEEGNVCSVRSAGHSMLA